MITFGVTAAAAFLLVPVMLTHLGPAGFGVWAIVRVFISYAALGDFGLNYSVTKFIAASKTKNEPEEISAIMQAAMLIYAGISLVIMVSFYLLKGPLIRLFFTAGGQYAEEIPFLLSASLWIFSFNLVFSVFPSLFNGLQRMDITNFVLSVSSLAGAALTYAVLVGGYGLRGLVYVNAGVTLFSVLLYGAFYASFFGVPRSLRWKPDFHLFRRLASYSKNIFISAVADGVHLHFDKLLLSSMLGLSAVSPYEVASRLIQYVRQIPALVLGPLLPAASEMETRLHFRKIVRLYHLSMKYHVVLMVPLLGCLGVFAKPLVKLWLGDGNEIVVATVQIFAVSNFINLLTAPGYFISLGIGKPQFAMRSAVLGLTVNIAASFALLKAFGYFGAVWGTFISLAVGAVFFLALLHRDLNVRWLPWLKLVAAPAAAFGIGYAAGALAEMFVAGVFFKLAAGGAVTLSVYGFLLAGSGYFDRRDKLNFRVFRAKLLRG